MSSVDALERAKNTPGCFYIRPPIDPYGTLDFGKFEEIYKVGYEFGRQFLEEKKDQGLLPGQMTQEEKERSMKRMVAPRRNSI